MSSSDQSPGDLPTNDLRVLTVPWADIEDSRESYGCPPCCRDIINDDVSLQPYETGVAECEGSKDGLNLAFRLNAKVESPDAQRQRGPADFSFLMTTSSATTTETTTAPRVSVTRAKLSPTPEEQTHPPPTTSAPACDTPSPSFEASSEDAEGDHDAYYRAAQEAAAAPGGYYDVFPDLSGAMGKRDAPKKANFRPSQRTKSQRERKAEQKAAAHDERLRPQRRDNEEAVTSEPLQTSPPQQVHRNDSKQKRVASESMSAEAPSSKRPKNDLDAKTRSSLFPIRQGNDPFALSQTLHPILFAPFLRSGTVPGEASPPDQRSGTPMPEPIMNDKEIECRTASRTKQVAIGKGTIGYRNYCTLVKRCKRTLVDPQTPDVRENSSKRDFDCKISIWKRALHAYDNMTVGDNVSR